MLGIRTAGRNLGVAVLLLTALPAFAQQQAITFFLPHAVCDQTSTSSTLEFFVNEQRIAVEPTRAGCECPTAAASTFEFTAPGALALLDPSSCNTFRVDVAAGSRPVYVGELLVRVTSGASSAETCLYDARRSAFPSLSCDGDPCKLFERNAVRSTGDADADGDGFIAQASARAATRVRVRSIPRRRTPTATASAMPATPDGPGFGRP